MSTKVKTPKKRTTKVTNRIDDKSMIEANEQRIIAEYEARRKGEVVVSFGNGLLHRKNLQQEMLEDITRTLAEGMEGFVNCEFVVKILTGKPTKSLARSRGTMEVNRATGKATFVIALFERNLEDAIFGDHTEQLVDGDAAHRVATPSNGWTGAYDEVCKMIGKDLVFCRAAIAKRNNAGTDEEQVELEKLASVSSGGRLNKQFKMYANTMKVFKGFEGDGREDGQIANAPKAFHPEFKNKMKDALKFWKPEFFTTREVVEATEKPVPIAMTKVASPVKTVDADGIAYWANVPTSLLDSGAVLKLELTLDNGKKSTVKMTADNFQLHRKNVSADFPKGTAPIAKRNGQMTKS